MATNTAGTAAFQLPWETIGAKRVRVNYNDSGITSGKKIATIPAGTRLFGALVYVKTAFNDSGTDTLTVGTNASSYNNIVASGDVDATTASKGTWVVTGFDLDITADTDVYVKYTGQNSDATAGVADIFLLTMPNI